MAKARSKSRQLEMLPRTRVSQSAVIAFAVEHGLPPVNASKLYKAAKLLQEAGFSVTKG